LGNYGRGGLLRSGTGDRSSSWSAGGGLPEGGGSATLAVAKNAFVGGADVGFEAGVVDFLKSIAGAAEEGKKAELPFHLADRRKVDFPEIEMRIEKGDAVGVPAGLLADLADDADFGFLVAFGPAEDEFLLRGKLVAGKDAGAVKAEEDGGGGLGKDFAVEVAPDEEDGDFLRKASASAHNLLWQAGGQREGSGGTN
jgi:hypothetical protein